MNPQHDPLRGDWENTYLSLYLFVSVSLSDFGKISVLFKLCNPTKLNQTFDLSKYIVGLRFPSFLSQEISVAPPLWGWGWALCEVSLSLEISTFWAIGADWSPLWIVGSLAPGSLATTWTRAGGNCNYSSSPATPALPAAPRRAPASASNHQQSPPSHSSTTTATARNRKCIGNPGRVSSYYQEMAWSSLLYCTQSKRSRRKIPRDQSKIIWIALLSSEFHLDTEKLEGPFKKIFPWSLRSRAVRSSYNKYRYSINVKCSTNSIQSFIRKSEACFLTNILEILKLAYN